MTLLNNFFATSDLAKELRSESGSAQQLDKSGRKLRMHSDPAVTKNPNSLSTKDRGILFNSGSIVSMELLSDSNICLVLKWTLFINSDDESGRNIPQNGTSPFSSPTKSAKIRAIIRSGKRLQQNTWEEDIKFRLRRNDEEGLRVRRQFVDYF